MTNVLLIDHPVINEELGHAGLDLDGGLALSVKCQAKQEQHSEDAGSERPRAVPDASRPKTTTATPR